MSFRLRLVKSVQGYLTTFMIGAINHAVPISANQQTVLIRVEVIMLPFTWKLQNMQLHRQSRVNNGGDLSVNQ